MLNHGRPRLQDMDAPTVMLVVSGFENVTDVL